MTCRQCSTPLKQTQGRYCSAQCANLGRTFVTPRPCARCPRMLTRRQVSKQQRYCTRQCARAAHIETTPMQDALLDILRGDRTWFWTVADLAIWVYGDDAESELHLIRMTLCRLRHRGYRFEQRAPNWLPVHGTTRAYRLISEPTTAIREAA